MFVSKWFCSSAIFCLPLLYFIRAAILSLNFVLLKFFGMKDLESVTNDIKSNIYAMIMGSLDKISLDLKTLSFLSKLIKGCAKLSRLISKAIIYLVRQ